MIPSIFPASLFLNPKATPHHPIRWQSMKHYILDAFNIIHKQREWKKSLLRSPDEAVQRLLLALSNYATRYTAYRFSVVLDGHHTEASSTAANIRVLSAGLERNADTLIKEMIAAHSADTKRHTDVVVISSDTEVYNYARLHAAEAISSEDFLRLLHSSATLGGQKSASAAPRAEKPAGVSKKQIKDFKELFGEELDEDWMDTL